MKENKAFTAHVTAEDIEAARECSAFNPVDIAFRRLEWEGASISCRTVDEHEGGARLTIWDNQGIPQLPAQNGDIYKFDLPEVAVASYLAWENGAREMEPFSFDMQIDAAYEWSQIPPIEFDYAKWERREKL